MRLIIWMLSLLLLVSCAPAPEVKSTPPIRVEGPSKAEVDKLRQLWSQVEGVVIADGDPLRISYPTGVLFAASALLPMPGGIAQLDTLVQNIKNSGRDWRLLVRAHSGERGDYDQTLAAARVNILKTYLDGAGLTQKQARLKVDNNPGAPLELQLVE